MTGMESSSDIEPVRNWTWEAMTPEDQAVLRPHMTRCHLPQGDVLMQADDPVDRVYFPVTADIANVVRLSDGSAGMATTVGRDGLTGLAAFLAKEPLGWDVQVQIGGYGWSLPADVLRRQFEVSPALADLMLTVTHKNQVEAARNAVCNLRHQVTQRLARWLLQTQDRTGLSEFLMTQDEMATLLGVRRTTMVMSCRELVASGAIFNRRGRIRVLSRKILKSQSCDCYGAPAQRP